MLRDGQAIAAVLLSVADGEIHRIVRHGGSELGQHERDRVRMLAVLGCVALAPDLFGEVFVDRAHGMRVMSAGRARNM